MCIASSPSRSLFVRTYNIALHIDSDLFTVKAGESERDPCLYTVLDMFHVRNKEERVKRDRVSNFLFIISTPSLLLDPR